MRYITHFLISILLCITQVLFAQEPDSSQLRISARFTKEVDKTATGLSTKLNKKTERYLKQFTKLEEKLLRKTARMDSALAAELKASGAAKLTAMEQSAKTLSQSPYIAELDSLTTAVQLLQQRPELISTVTDAGNQLKGLQQKMATLKADFARAEAVKKYLADRKAELKSRLEQIGLAKQLKQINKQAYYYSAQINEYKNALKDPDKAVKKGLELLSKNKTFREFWRKNSQLAGLFRLPGDDANSGNLTSLAGLQTRAQVNNLIQQQLSAGGPNAQAQLQQNMQAAQSQLAQLKDKVMKFGGSSSDATMPEGFKPNNQKTKSFLQRIELGTNIQSVRSNGLLPLTSDLGLSFGYKLNDKSIIGIGASYKMGWGRNIQNVSITHQGVGARSFVDWKLKGALWISGGFEMNYRSQIRSIEQLKDYPAWQRSGLIGLSRKIPLKTKFFKNTKLMLLWDFLSYEQVPRGQPVLVRIGYNLK